MIKNIIKDNSFKINIINDSVHIINYVNIINISPNVINILLNDKTLKISGNNMLICGLDEYELLIKGNIKGLEFINE